MGKPRTRSSRTEKIVPMNYHGHYYDERGVVTYPLPPLMTYSFIQDMHDVVNERVGGKFYPPSNVLHTKVTSFYSDEPYSYGAVIPVNGWIKTVADSPACAFYREAGFPDPHTRPEAEPDSNNFCVRAYNAMRPSLTPDFDLSVFLVELGEIKDLFEVFRKKYWQEYTLLKVANDQHLSYQFGWKPMVGDLKKIIDRLLSLDWSISSLAHMQNRWITRRYREKVKVEGGPVVTNYGSARAYVDLEPYEIIYNATMVFRYFLPDYNSRSGKLKAYLDALGLVNGWASLWELVPFSFVVDWFVDIGGWLAGNFHQDATSVTVELGYFMYSVKYEYQSSCDIEIALPSEYWSDGRKLHSRKSSKYYKRALCSPPTYLELEAGSGMKWILGSSLAGGLLYKGKRR